VKKYHKAAVEMKAKAKEALDETKGKR